MDKTGEPKRATAIISVAVKPGCEAEHEEWRRGIRSAAAGYPGYVGAESFEPVPGFQEHWVHVIRFDSPETLRAWLESEDRRQWLGRGEHLFSSPQELQTVMRSPPKGGAVSAVFSQRIKAGREGEFLRAHEEIHGALRGAAGFEALESYPPVPGVQEEWVDIVRFRDTASLEAWMVSGERKARLSAMAPLMENASVRKIAPGFDAWFPLGGGRSPTPRWKQALAVFFSLYPTVMATNALVAATFPVTSRPAMTLVGNAISVAVLNWLAMPAANVLLRPFLSARGGDWRANLLGVAGVGLWLAAWFAIWSVLPK